jgi:NADH-quinone oxidoreductase subunit J
MARALFWSFGIISVLGALGVLLNVRSTIHAALSLVVSLLGISGLFVLLQAELIGVLQVLVYAGAIVVLFVFVIMLLNVRGGRLGAENQPIMKIIGAVVVFAATVKLGALLETGSQTWAEVPRAFGTVENVAGVLYTDHLLAFEVSGILLLAGIVGAVALAKRELD